MAKQLSKTGITTNTTIKAWHVTQSINALTGIDAYDISISGSLNITGSLTTTGNISASGDIYSTVFYSDRQDTIYYRPASDNIIIGGLGGKPLRVNGVYSTSNITASGIVEALTTVGNRNALAQNNSGGAINTTMTIAAFPRGTVTGVTQTTSNNAVAYTLPAIEAGLEYTFIATATSTGTGTTTFSAPSAILKGMAVCKDANEDISGTNFIFAAGKFEIGTRVYIIGDGTIYHITKVVSKGGGSVYDVWERVEKLTPKEKKKFIQVIVKVKGNMEYSSPHIYTMKKEVQNNLDITVEDVKLVAEAVLGIKLQIENIHV